ncbi:MAG: Hypothetical signal peptide protein [uncultured Sulfurovum sp.]|uniref:Hypothetical signal peptide protein n=1 Tax=uncultured Sulfurovum sp. TaxID=269237 RepID=A0A6S6TPC7_9BACT|nr:MAG: Hypothetical signal peptide protein [uncultured Sulfurovum sp.]
MKVLLSTVVLTVSLMSMVQANVSINASSYQKTIKLNENAEEVIAWVQAQKVVPGTIIRYVNTLENSGQQLATKLVIDNPVPTHMEYIENSALCQSACTLSYSVDGGKSYNNPEALFVGVGEERHLAKASEYTNIRWTVERLGAVSQSLVEYKAQLK